MDVFILVVLLSDLFELICMLWLLLFQKLVYSDAVFQNNIPIFISQLRAQNPISKQVMCVVCLGSWVESQKIFLYFHRSFLSICSIHIFFLFYKDSFYKHLFKKQNPWITLYMYICKIFRIKGRIRNCELLRIFTLAFLIFLASAGECNPVGPFFTLQGNH